jgi:hypothetical protein
MTLLEGDAADRIGASIPVTPPLALLTPETSRWVIWVQMKSGSLWVKSRAKDVAESSTLTRSAETSGLSAEIPKVLVEISSKTAAMWMEFNGAFSSQPTSYFCRNHRSVERFELGVVLGGKRTESEASL